MTMSKTFTRSTKTTTRSIFNLFDTLLLQLAYREDHVGGAAVWTESTLGFRQVFLRDVGDEAVEDDPSQDLSSNGQERDAPVVAAVSLTAPVLNRETNVAFLNSLGTPSSSQMLVRSKWSASRATGPTYLKISARIPSILGDFPELVCLIAFEASSIAGGKSRLVIMGFCGIWSSTVGSTVEDPLSRVLKCSFHLALMLLYSLNGTEPSADWSSVVHGLVWP